MDRRGFLAGMLAACAGPAIVRADSLMRIVARETAVLRLDTLYGFYAMPAQRFLNAYPEDFSRAVVDPTMRRLAQNIDRDMLALLGGVNRQFDENFESRERTVIQLPKR